MVPVAFRPAFARPVPWVTWAVTVACAAVFAVQVLQRPDPFALFCSDLEESALARQAAAGSVQAFVCRWGAIPDELHEGRDLHTALTAMLLHAGWVHLVVNLAYLLAFGPLVERAVGRARYLLVLVVAGVAAQGAHVLADRSSTTPSVGISGALAAVLALHLVLGGRRDVRVLVGPVPVRLPAWFVLGFWAVQQLALTVLVVRRAEPLQGPAPESHLAGFAVGLLVALVLRWARRFAGEVPLQPVGTESTAPAPSEWSGPESTTTVRKGSL